MRKPSAYLETTVVSVLTARPTRDLVQSAWQQITAEWWETRRAELELFVSRQVITEVARGDAAAAQRRLNALAGIAEVDVSDEVIRLAGTLAKTLKLPPKKAPDAVHIAAAAVHRITFLVTWNCTHLANPIMEAKAKEVCLTHGLVCPMIVTPHQLLELEL